jgi:predicted nucleic acid-binding protein
VYSAPLSHGISETEALAAERLANRIPVLTLDKRRRQVAKDLKLTVLEP